MLMAFSLRAAVFFFIAIGATLVVPGEAAKKAPAVKPSSGPFKFVKCPTRPLQYCDFYWGGYKTTVPTFTIKRFTQDTILHSGYLFSGKTFQPVFTASSYGFCYFVPEYKKTHPKCSTSFYFKGRRTPLNSNLLAARTVVSAKYKEYASACVVLPVATAKIRTQKAEGKKKAQYMFINPNDGNKQYPQSRRCVVFKTKLG